MANSVNGYVTIQVGVANGQRSVRPARSLDAEERNRQARRLRKDGYSYRRIAATTGMSYAAVCHLLDGEEARAPLVFGAPPPGAPPPGPAPVVPVAALSTSVPTASARLEEMAAQILHLQHRLDILLAQAETHRQGLARLERTLVATVQSENRALGQRITGSVRALLERMLPGRTRSQPGGEEGGEREPG